MANSSLTSGVISLSGMSGILKSLFCMTIIVTATYPIVKQLPALIERLHLWIMCRKTPLFTTHDLFFRVRSRNTITTPRTSSDLLIILRGILACSSRNDLDMSQAVAKSPLEPLKPINQFLPLASPVNIAQLRLASHLAKEPPSSLFSKCLATPSSVTFVVTRIARARYKNHLRVS